MEQPVPQFLDVEWLLEASEPKPRIKFGWYAVGVVVLIIMMSAYVSGSSTGGAILVQFMSLMLSVGVIVGMSFYTMHTVRQQREAQLQLEAAEELTAIGAEQELQENAGVWQCNPEEPLLHPFPADHTGIAEGEGRSEVGGG